MVSRPEHGTFQGLSKRNHSSAFADHVKITGVPFSKLIPIPDGKFKSFQNCSVKLSAKETKWTSLEVRTNPNLLETKFQNMISGPFNYGHGSQHQIETILSFRRRAKLTFAVSLRSPCLLKSCSQHLNINVGSEKLKKVLTAVLFKCIC